MKKYLFRVSASVKNINVFKKGICKLLNTFNPGTNVEIQRYLFSYPGALISFKTTLTKPNPPNPP